MAVGRAPQHRGLGGSAWLLAPLVTVRGSFPCTVRGPVTNCSCGSSDSAPTEASVPVLSPAWLPLEVPATGSCSPRVYEPTPTAPRPGPPSVSSHNKQGRQGPGSTQGGTPPSFCVPGNIQLLSLENQHPLPGNPVAHRPQPTPSNPEASCSLHEEQRPPARGAHPHPSCHFPKETPVYETKFSAQNTVEGEGEKSSPLSPESRHFLLSETPSPGWVGHGLNHSAGNRVGHRLCVRASKTLANPEIPSGSWLDNFVPEL